MTKGFYNLTSGMLTQGRHLDVISNNMANVATVGYKADRFTGSTFQDVMWKLVGNKNKNYTDLGNQSFITAPSRLYTDYTQGELEETGQPLDFAIDGDGFFAIQTYDGNRMLTRNGNFSLDAEGYLCLPGQGRVLGQSGNPIQVLVDNFVTDDYGGLYTDMTGRGGFFGRIGVFNVDDPQDALVKNAQGHFDGPDGVQTNVKIYNGYVERANTDLVQQMTEMISTQRAYQSAAEVIKMYDTVLNRVTTEVGRMT